MDQPDQATRILVSSLHGTINHLVRLNPAQDAPFDEAVAAVQDLVGGRGDGSELLAHVAGIIIGAAQWPETLDRAARAARVLVAAGADEFLIDGWACIGAERVAARQPPPFSRPRRRTSNAGPLLVGSPA